ncbi:trans-aconitate methyltransferase 1 [Tieghemiomyces parasiticus]|uniref:Trans-aconitate methyltransferase 1 n=1 Tax=Tieghemiomyces parasiticus TaxID=78921 RepID=A0A9W8AD44_9FUNG|nr:trans-aconitate methyltransferase 1 [Tieghemiomyces parasiticus]
MSAFSDQDFNSASYSAYRPTYDPSVIRRVTTYHAAHQITNATSKQGRHFSLTVDLATGTGQMCELLSPVSDRVYGLDISATMIKSAVQLPNVQYSVSPAEGPWDAAIAPRSVDLVTIAQGAHWFKRPQAWHQIQRMLKPRGTLAIVGYSFVSFGGKPRAAELLWKLATASTLLGPFWEQGREYVETLLGDWHIPFDNVVRLYSPPGLVAPSHRQQHGQSDKTTVPASSMCLEGLKHIHSAQTANGWYLPAPESYMRKTLTPHEIVLYLQTWSSYKRFCHVHPDRQGIVREYVEMMMDAEGCHAWDEPWETDWNHVLILATNPAETREESL